MVRAPNRLVKGNSKLGEGIWSWSLPAALTCPGRSPACESACYARRGRFLTDGVAGRLARNLEFAFDPHFERALAAEVNRRGCHVVRVHVAGDFFDAEYAAAWTRIARRCPRARFYAYTRSWRDADIRAALVRTAALPNFRLWLSADADTGLPRPIPGAKVAWLVTTEGEKPHPGADLAFRTKVLRKRPAFRLNLVTVCGTETGTPAAAATTCSGCQRCWR